MAQNMEDNTTDAQNQLAVNFADNTTATIPFAAGSVQVRVVDNQVPPRPIAGAQVEIMDGTTVVTQGATDATGEVALEVNLSNQELFTTRTVRIVASQAGFAPSEQSATVIAVATVDVNLTLVPLPQ